MNKCWSLLLVVLSSGCVSTNSTSQQLVYLAQAAVECSPNDSTVSCCIKQHPGDPERCGVAAPPKPDVDDTVRAAEAASESAREKEADPEEGYRDHCIDMYVLCQLRKWSRNCHDCLRYCQGQKQWPFDVCGKR
jgi:hypothetical protein